MSDEYYGSDSDIENSPFYYERPEWNDVTPIPQNDGPNPVVAIAYSEAFKDVYSYFRAIVKKKEYSYRAFYLTTRAIIMNPANYTVWQYRRKILENIEVDLELELNFCRYMIESSPKNYQVWHHRRIVVKWLNDPSKELNFTKIIFASDPKNYHAWEHRQWTLKTFNLFDGELKFVHELLRQDLQNNSVWNQRYFVISNTTGYTQEIVEKEIIYAQKFIETLPNNESAWNYLQGVQRQDSRDLYSNDSLVKWVYDLSSNEGSNCSFVSSFILSVIEDKLKHEPDNSKQLLHEAMEICNNLATKSDRIREYYWRQRFDNINQLYLR